jgi:hypothetical protein
MDAKLDAKRLEELAAWAKCQERSLIANEITDVAEYFRDLARCAAAWAKVERMQGRLELEGSLAVYLFPKGGGLQDYTTADTAIAAVEAAPEVPNANKG